MNLDSASLPPNIIAARNRKAALSPPPDRAIAARNSPPVTSESPKQGDSAETPVAGNGGISGNVIRFVITGEPMGKPRMTQRDKWKKRPVVLRYRAWADLARASVPVPASRFIADPLTVSWTAYLPMPKSWSCKKKDFMRGTLHRQKPDRDNIDKAILDALFTSDCGVAAGTLVKRWDDGRGPRVEVEVTTL